MGDRISAKIFKIDYLGDDTDSIQTEIAHTISKHNEKSGNQFYEYIESDSGDPEIRTHLYVHVPADNEPGWASVLSEISDSPRINAIKTKYPSFILLFVYKSEIYAITGGAGYRVIDPIIDDEFGISIIERLIDPNNSMIRAIAQRGFVGVELAANRLFRSGHVFSDEETFGKYFKGLDVFISQSNLKKIGIETNKPHLLLRGESGLRIDTKVDIQDIINRVKKLIYLVENEERKENLNPFRKIKKKNLEKPIDGKILFDHLEHELKEMFFRYFSQISELEIFHPNLDEYFVASSIVAHYQKNDVEINTAQKITLRLIFGKLSIDLENLDLGKFKSLLSKITVSIPSGPEQKKYYNYPLEQWLYGEIEFKGQKYLKYEGQWYIYDDDFIVQLDKRLDTLKDKIFQEKMETWSYEDSEGDYNEQYRTKENHIVADRRLVDEIEIADIISWNTDTIFLYHVKDGIDRNLRVLQSQIINSAKYLSEFRLNPSSKKIDDYYRYLENNYNSNGGSLPTREEFKKIIQRKYVVFVFAIATETDSSNLSDTIDEIKSKKTAVPKIALLHSYYTIKSMDYEFRIAKIKHEKV